jgi:hypothetical protein
VLHYITVRDGEDASVVDVHVGVETCEDDGAEQRKPILDQKNKRNVDQRPAREKTSINGLGKDSLGQLINTIGDASLRYGQGQHCPDKDPHGYSPLGHTYKWKL